MSFLFTLSRLTLTLELGEKISKILYIVLAESHGEARLDTDYRVNTVSG